MEYNYVKNHYILLAVGLSRQKELDANSKAVQQTEFVGQVKNIDGINVTKYVCFNNFRTN